MIRLRRVMPVIVALLLAPAAGWAQSAPARTAWGAPDLQGVWNHGTATPLERPERHSGRERLISDEVAEVNAAQRSAEGVGARRVVWWERRLSDGRTNIHIAQTSDHVLLLHVMIHEFRIVPLDGRPHLPESVRQWLGDARGWWEGDTLVVETTNIRPDQRFRGLSQGTMRLVERFTRVGADELRYEVTFEDPKLWTQPWTATLLMPPTDGPMFEYACHERNDGMTALLDIARGEEAAASGASGLR